MTNLDGSASPRHDADCIFCKIIAGQIPCHKLYEDDRVLAFLDVGPLSRGHCLIIPKEHYTTIDQMPAGLVSACAVVLPKLSQAIIAATGSAGWNILQNNGAVAGQEVHHVHFHIIPRADGDALGYRWPAGTLDGNTAKQLIKAITDELQNSE